MKRTALVLAILLLAGCAKQKNLETAVIAAKTMVCDKCAQTVEKAVYRVEGVKEVEVALKEKSVTVKYLPEQTNLETIVLAISDAGYDANDRKRDPAAYEALDACCKTDE
jgi:copper chaperone CopZ